MDPVERFAICLRREGEPDRIPSFLQGIMPLFLNAWDDKYGEDLEDDMVVLTPLKDFTVYKHLGFDATWIGVPGGRRVFGEHTQKLMKEMNDALPEEKRKDGYRIDIYGSMKHDGYLNGLPYTYTHEGVLKSEELFSEWYGDSYVTDPPENAVDLVNETFRSAVEKGVIPIFSIGFLSEKIIARVSILAAAKWYRKNPAFLHKVLDTFLEEEEAKINVICQSEAPFVIIPDDCAYKNRPIYPPKMYKEFFIPRWKKVISKLHAAGKLVIFHSDGYVEPYYDMLIDAGLDAHQSLEPVAGMDLKLLKEKYGDKLTLIGNIDVSRLLPYGTKEEVIAATKKCIADGGPGGGYIFGPCSDLTNMCKLENVEAMMETYKKYRNYPLKVPLE